MQIRTALETPFYLWKCRQCQQVLRDCKDPDINLDVMTFCGDETA